MATIAISNSKFCLLAKVPFADYLPSTCIASTMGSLGKEQASHGKTDHRVGDGSYRLIIALVLDLCRVLAIPGCCIHSGQLCCISFASWVTLIHPELNCMLTDGRLGYMIYDADLSACVIAQKVGVWDGILWLPGVSINHILYCPLHLLKLSRYSFCSSV